MITLTDLTRFQFGASCFFHTQKDPRNLAFLLKKGSRAILYLSFLEYQPLHTQELLEAPRNVSLYLGRPKRRELDKDLQGTTWQFDSGHQRVVFLG